MKLLTGKFYCILATVCVFLLAGCDNNDFIDYRQKLVLSVAWGAEAGRFGLAVPPEGEIVGPRIFAIGDDGRIHIFDSIKKNIKVFSRDGVFQGSIGKNLPGYNFTLYKGHYYLLDGEVVHQYALSGTPVAKFPIAGALTLYEGYGQWMRIDERGDLYVKSQGRTYHICTCVGEKAVVLSEEAQIRSQRKGMPDRSGTLWFAPVKENAGRFKMIIYDRDGKIVNEFPIETSDTFGHLIFLDRDEKGIIYVETERIGKDRIARLEIRRYRNDGRLIQRVEIPNRYYSIVYKKVAVDRKGRLYQLQTMPSGVGIARWDK